MVFQRRAKKDDYKFHIGNETIDIVQNYVMFKKRAGVFYQVKNTRRNLIKHDPRVY